ncbi:MAG: TlpA family protein disulfide reductase [Pseudobacter sp.]|uniref:TlpA family protein disulfide reductase n=1 Tax=Pseudobacter sp. TaxID=2045420 RepID=UPI003F7D023C
MKRIQIALLIFLVCPFLSMAGKLPGEGSFSINLTLKGLADGKNIYLVTMKAADAADPRKSFNDTVAVTQSKSENATFTGTAGGDGQRFAILVEGSKQKLLLLLSRNEKLTVSGSLETWPKVNTTGSNGTAQMNAYKEFVTKAIKAETKTAELNATIMKYISERHDDLYTPFALLQNDAMTKSEKESLFEKMTTVSKNSYYGVMLSDAIKNNKLSKVIREGLEIPDLKLTMSTGEVMTMKEIAAKNKLTLIDFWGTWCGPCIGEFPYMKELYKEWKGKGLGILGITQKENKETWKKVIAQHEVNWLHGSDDFDKIMDGVFKLGSVPAFGLMDQDGKMIAFVANRSGTPNFGPYIYHEGLVEVLKKTLK